METFEADRVTDLTVAAISVPAANQVTMLSWCVFGSGLRSHMEANTHFGTTVEDKGSIFVKDCE